jgi:hypothetical protein
MESTNPDAAHNVLKEGAGNGHGGHLKNLDRYPIKSNSIPTFSIFNDSFFPNESKTW